MDIAGTFQHGKGNFWTALYGENVVGTIGVVDISNNQVALKKMFVAKDFRGKDKGVSQLLMDTAIEWCKQKGVSQIYLGTTAKMYAAHRFYEKNGFVELTTDQLPPDFPIVSVDTKFYCRTF
ncbi:MAG: GNAT family N-acetyltransferase [Cyanobacteria bacterium SZAS-4]|nr:GNAT family N-acetyltransferase [Cyanobacteria bacterium SZAS-4]